MIYGAEIDGQPGRNQGAGWRAKLSVHCDAVEFSFCHFLFKKKVARRIETETESAAGKNGTRP